MSKPPFLSPRGRPMPCPEIMEREYACLYTPPETFNTLLDAETRAFFLTFGGVEAFPERRAQYEAAGLAWPESPAEFLDRLAKGSSA